MKCPNCQFEIPDPVSEDTPTPPAKPALKAPRLQRHAPARSINDSFDALFQHPIPEEEQD